MLCQGSAGSALFFSSLWSEIDENQDYLWLLFCCANKVAAAHGTSRQKGLKKKKKKKKCMRISRSPKGKFFMSKHLLAACLECLDLNNIRKAVAWILPVGALGRPREVPQLLLLLHATEQATRCSCFNLFLDMETSASLWYSALLLWEGCQKKFSFCAPFCCDLIIYSSELCSTFPAKPYSPDCLDVFLSTDATCKISEK